MGSSSSKKYKFQQNEDNETIYICNLKDLRTQQTRRITNCKAIQDIHNRFVYFKLKCPKNYLDIMQWHYTVSIQYNELNIVHACSFDISPDAWKESKTIIGGIEYREVSFPCTIYNCSDTLLIRYNFDKKKEFIFIYKNNV
jgi:hypothetical protein